MDLDGDQQLDVISGSWPGELYLFRGQGKGKFKEGETLKDRGGKPIKLGSASTAFAADWDGDGKLDLLVGSIEGKMYFVPNEGGAGKPAFGKAQVLEADGKPIQVPHGDSHPIAADWDGDGKLDLLTGSGAGSVLWFRNVGTAKAPKLAAAHVLVKEAPMQRRPDEKPARHGCGMRTKLCVTDWDGDGKLDLLVGDFALNVGETPKLTKEEEKVKADAERKQQQFLQSFFQQQQEVEKLQKAPKDETDEAREERQQKLKAGREKLNQALQEYQQVAQTVQKYRPKYSYAGNVWLLLRKPAADAPAAP